MQTQTTPAPTPELIFSTFNAYQRTAALKAGIELDVFTRIAEGASTLQALAEKCQASERGIRILCDYLVIIGLLTKEDDRYGLKPDAALFLDRHSPACVAGAAPFLTSPGLTDGFKDLASAVRKGGKGINNDGSFGPDNSQWVQFARTMVPIVAPAADGIAELIGARKGEKWKVLDVAAGHGVFGITIAKWNPNSEVVAIDWEPVLSVALENAEKAGVARRYRTIPGNAFEVDFGDGYDIVLLTNFLHHFDVATCEDLLRKVHRSLRPGGRAATLEFVPNEDRVSPPVPAEFSMMMLGATTGGDAYTFSDLDRMFRNAGFSRSENHPLARSPQRLVISTR